MDNKLLVEQIDKLLPQTQCERCGYPGCKPYAQAIVHEGAGINLCVPGQDVTAQSLADLTSQPFEPVKERPNQPQQTVALINEQSCIGCTKCIQACPVDAIIGAAKKMHTVISDFCTGCDLCLPVCPVDCIDMVTVAPEVPTHLINASPARKQKADEAKIRFENRKVRLNSIKVQKQEKYQQIVKERNIKSQLSDILARNKNKTPSLQVYTDEPSQT